MNSFDATNRWRAWYQTHTRECWEVVLPNCLCAWVGIHSFPLYRHYYQASSSEGGKRRTEDEALRLLITMIILKHRYTNFSERTAAIHYKNTYSSWKKSPSTSTTNHIYGKFGWKSTHFLNFLQTHSASDGILENHYKLFLEILDKMVKEKLGDSFMIHHIAWTLLKSPRVPSEVTALWKPIFEGENLYNYTYCSTHTEAIEIWLKHAESQCYALEGDVFQFKSPVMNYAMTLLECQTVFPTCFKPSDLVPEKTGKKGDVKCENGVIDATPFTKNGNSRKQRSIEDIQRLPKLKQYLNTLDTFALVELNDHLSKPLMIVKTQELGSEQIRLGEHLLLRYTPSGNNSSISYLGPFDSRETDHRIALGRTLFRARKLKEWFSILDSKQDRKKGAAPLSKEEAAPLSKEEAVPLSKEDRKEEKEKEKEQEKQEDRGETEVLETEVLKSHEDLRKVLIPSVSLVQEHENIVWLRYEMAPIASQEFHDGIKNHPSFPEFGQSCVLLQMCRFLLGMADNSLSKFAHTVYTAGHISPLQMFKMRSADSYIIIPNHHKKALCSTTFASLNAINEHTDQTVFNRRMQEMRKVQMLFFTEDFKSRSNSVCSRRQIRQAEELKQNWVLYNPNRDLFLADMEMISLFWPYKFTQENEKILKAIQIDKDLNQHFGSIIDLLK